MKFHMHAKESSEAMQLLGPGGALTHPDCDIERKTSPGCIAIMYVMTALMVHHGRTTSLGSRNLIHERTPC